MTSGGFWTWHGEKHRNWLRAACGVRYEWRNPNEVLVFQDSTDRSGATVFWGHAEGRQWEGTGPSLQQQAGGEHERSFLLSRRVNFVEISCLCGKTSAFLFHLNAQVWMFLMFSLCDVAALQHLRFLQFKDGLCNSMERVMRLGWNGMLFNVLTVHVCFVLNSDVCVAGDTMLDGLARFATGATSPSSSGTVKNT